MPELDYEALAFYLALLTLIGTGFYKGIGWIIRVNREIEANKVEAKRLQKETDDLKEEFSKLNETVKNFGVEMVTRNSELIQATIALKEGIEK